MSYIPGTKEEQQEMLKAIGYDAFSDLYASIPEEILLKEPLALKEGLSELELLEEMHRLAEKNKVFKTVLRGAGAYKHYIPATVDALSSRGEFLTAYTPYQAELSQGILQNIFEYQTMICEITGMDVANASVYDGATAAGEAALMVKDRKRHKLLVSSAADPIVISTIKTYAIPAGIEVEMIPMQNGITDYEKLKEQLNDSIAGVYLAQPNYYGSLEDMTLVAELTHAVGAKFIAGVNPISLGMIAPPGEYGADIAVGDGQPLGIPLSFGGPGFGFMATTKAMMRKLPGRIVGETTDHHGKRAFVLTLQAREQHIRREKASSNICSNQAWCALRGAIYLSTVGKEGFGEVAMACYENAHALQEALSSLGFSLINHTPFFHEFVTSSPVPASELEKALMKKGILAGLPLADNNILWCATELIREKEIAEIVAAIEGVLS
jgi:glycine cleavage system pyridoxal-binding protein P